MDCHKSVPGCRAKDKGDRKGGKFIKRQENLSYKQNGNSCYHELMYEIKNSNTFRGFILTNTRQLAKKSAKETDLSIQ